MEDNKFDKVIERFKSADLNGKIDIYVTAQGLTTEQYKQLLKLYPINEIWRLEKALA